MRLIVLAVLVSAIGWSQAQTLGRSQPSGLRIVVIAGEDAVNIIQQKTAVAPIVEVRDRNDQPVAGAVVNFVIRNGRASFGGARTLRVTTDVVGRAVAGGLTPTGTGALQISASAAFQGQSAAAITITQTNVLTAAQAAAIGAGAGGGTTASGAGTAGGAGGGSGGAAAGAGGAAGGGGGLSGTTLGILGGVAGAGVLAATQLGGGDSNPPSAPQTSTPPTPAPPPTQSSTLYDIVMTPAVTTVNQCPQGATVPGTGPMGTALSFFADGSFSGDLFAGTSTQPSVRVVTIAGQSTATSLSGTMVCIGGGGPSGSLSGTGSRSQYQGTWNFGGIGGTFTLTPK